MSVSQRRAVSSKLNLESDLAPPSRNILESESASSLPPSKAIREVKTLSLDADTTTSTHHMIVGDEECDEETVPLDHASRNETDYATSKRMRRLKLWKESPFAVGLTEPTWMEERYRDRYSSDVPPDESGCLCMSAYVCPLFGASRVGNMAVLKTSQEWVEEVENSEAAEPSSQPSLRRFSRPRLDVVIGPYWPMLFFVTYPLIFGVSAWTLFSGILRPGTSIVLQFLWTVCTLGLIVSLTRTACRDPGILYRHRQPKDSTWRWSDQADTYRPRHAWYDMDTAVMVEGFDHTYVSFIYPLFLRLDVYLFL
jgi:hypothetical protein